MDEKTDGKEKLETILNDANPYSNDANAYFKRAEHSGEFLSSRINYLASAIYKQTDAILLKLGYDLDSPIKTALKVLYMASESRRTMKRDSYDALKSAYLNLVYLYDSIKQDDSK